MLFVWSWVVCGECLPAVLRCEVDIKLYASALQEDVCEQK